MLERRVFGDAGARVVVEEYLEGEEVSVFALTDGRTVCPLASAQDHKAVFDGDRGPNTGGMGAYSPAPALDPALSREVVRTVLEPTIRGMSAEGRPYRGVLFAGLMLTAAGPRVLEYNVRFGDPECQVLMLRLADDLLPLCQAVAEGRGLPPSVAWRPEAAVCVVLASGGYPGDHRTGLPIEGIERAEAHAGVTVFHAGTAWRDGRLTTAGGRVLGVTALGADLRVAVADAYGAAGEIRFDGVHYRRDIGHRALRAPRPAPRSDRPIAVSRPARLVVDASHPAPAALEAAARVLRDGGLVAFPTETFYGLGARALDASAVARIFEAKGRPEDKPLLVLVDSLAMVERVAGEVPLRARRLMARYWPGALTLVLPARMPTCRRRSRRAPGRSASGCPVTRWPARSSRPPESR